MKKIALLLSVDVEQLSFLSLFMSLTYSHRFTIINCSWFKMKSFRCKQCKQVNKDVDGMNATEHCELVRKRVQKFAGMPFINTPFQIRLLIKWMKMMYLIRLLFIWASFYLRWLRIQHSDLVTMNSSLYSTLEFVVFSCVGFFFFVFVELFGSRAFIAYFLYFLRFRWIIWWFILFRWCCLSIQHRFDSHVSFSNSKSSTKSTRLKSYWKRAVLNIITCLMACDYLYDPRKWKSDLCWVIRCLKRSQKTELRIALECCKCEHWFNHTTETVKRYGNYKNESKNIGRF